MFQNHCVSSTRAGIFASATIIGLAMLSDRLGAEESEFPPRGQTRSGQRVDVAEGAIDPGEFFRFIADFTGVAVIVHPASTGQLERSIHVVAPIVGADDETVMKLLEANGWRGTRKTLADGREAIEMRHAGPSRSTGARAPRRVTRSGTGATPAPARADGSADTGSRGTPDVAAGPVLELRDGALFERRGGSFVEVEGSSDSLLASGVAPDARATVVVPLAVLEPKGAVATLLAVIRAFRPGGEDLVVVEVRGARKVILAGKASHVDYALRLVRAIDDPAAADRTSAVIWVEHREVEELAGSIRKVLALSCTSRARAPVDVTADARAGALVVEADPEVIENLRRFVRENDVQAASRRMRTRIHQLRRLEAIPTANTLGRIFGSVAMLVPHHETNSLLIQAGPEDFAQILGVLAELDAAARPDGPEGDEQPTGRPPSP